MMQNSRYIFDAPAELKRLSEMIFVEGGSFLMGEHVFEHLVKLDSFYIGKFPVTQILWKAVMNDENPSHFTGNNHPVETVSWEDTQIFIKKLSQLTGKEYRLPTEAQWEYAAKGGIYSQDLTLAYSGSNKLNEVGWFDENSYEETKPVGLKTSNLLGIHDMSGNVWEWCNDWYANILEVKRQSKKDEVTGAIINPKGVKNGSHHVYRGGSWKSIDMNHSFKVRRYSEPSFNDTGLGFRLALV